MSRILTALIVLLVTASMRAQTGPRDFARGIEVSTDAGGAIFRVMLPRDVYLTTRQPNLEDLRVFNASGTPVPTTIRRVASTSAVKEELVSVPIFPLYTKAAAGLGTSAQVRINRQGAVVEVSGNRAAGEMLTSYLVDVSSVKEPLAGLQLDWQARGERRFSWARPRRGFRRFKPMAHTAASGSRRADASGFLHDHSAQHRIVRSTCAVPPALVAQGIASRRAHQRSGAPTGECAVSRTEMGDLDAGSGTGFSR